MVILIKRLALVLLLVLPALAVNNMTFKNVSGSSISNYPMQFGRQFLKGEIAAYPQVLVNAVAITTQANVETRWNDGSAKHVILSFILVGPVIDTGTAVFTFQNQAGCNCGSGVHATRANMLNTGTYDFDASIGNGVTTISARAMVTAWDGTTVGPTGMQYWADGSIATTLLIADHSTARASDFGTDAFKSLRPLFYCTFWPSLGKVKVRLIVENTNTETLQEQVWSVTLKTGNAAPATVYTKANISQYTGTRWTKVFWIGGAPTELYNLDHNLAYLKTTYATPNYDTTKSLTEANIVADYSDWLPRAKDIYDAGGWQKLMSSGGGRPDIGPFATWAVNWLYTGDYREREIALGNADLAAAWAMHYREGTSGKFMDRAQVVPAQGHAISISARPSLSFNQDFTESGVAATDKITPVGIACNPHGGGTYSITSASWAVGVATITVASNKLVSGQVVKITSVNPTGYNGTTLTVTGATPTTFTYNLASNPGPWVSGGTVTWSDCAWRWDAAHIISAFKVPYLLTGDYWYLEEQWFWAAYSTAYAPSSGKYGRGPLNTNGGVYSGELRAIAWAFRERFETGDASPDGTPEKALINAWTDDMLAEFDGAENLTDSFYNGGTLWNWGRNTKAAYAAQDFFATTMPMPLGQFWKRSNGPIPTAGLADSRVTTITANIDASVTSIPVASTALMPPVPFCAAMGGERVRATALNGLIYIVTRNESANTTNYGCRSNTISAAATHNSGDAFYTTSQGGYGMYAPNVYEADSAFEFAYLCYVLGRGAELGYHSDIMLRHTCAVWYNNVINSSDFNPNLIVAGRMPTSKFSDHSYFTTMADLKTAYNPTLADAKANGAVTGSPLCYRWKDTTCVDLSDPQNAYPILAATAISYITPYTGGAAAWAWALANVEGATTYEGNPKWAILPRNLTCAIATGSCPTAIKGQAYTCQLVQNNCAGSTWTKPTGSLPTGLSLNASTGAITGTPNDASTPTTSSFTVAYDTDTQALTILDTVPPTITTTSPLTAATQNSAYTPLQFTATGDNTNNCTGCTWSATGVPTGMAFSSAGILSGTPTALSTATLTVTATSASGISTTGTFSLTINPAASTTCPLNTFCINGTININGQIIKVN